MSDSPRGSRTGPKSDPARQWLSEMIATQRVSRVTPNVNRSNDLLVQAKAHVGSARTLLSTDTTLALAACHDAIRKAIDADAGANGYRIENKPGAHRTTIEYAETQLGDTLAAEDLRIADRLRTRRHATEYGTTPAAAVTAREIEDYAETAERIVRAIIGRRLAT